jgi:hypothetical protein
MSSASRNLTDKAAAKLWTKRPPTARPGHPIDELAAEDFSKNLQAHGTIDATITPFLT